MIQEYDFTEVPKLDIKAALVILDIDGTLTSAGAFEVSEPIINVVQDLKKENTVYLCSNKRNLKRNKHIAELLGVIFLDTPYRKPNRKILDYFENPEQKPMVVIGDKILTDGFFAKRIKARFIKVKRISSPEESLLDKTFSFIDNCAWQIFCFFG